MEVYRKEFEPIFMKGSRQRHQFLSNIIYKAALLVASPCYFKGTQRKYKNVVLCSQVMVCFLMWFDCFDMCPMALTCIILYDK